MSDLTMPVEREVVLTWDYEPGQAATHEEPGFPECWNVVSYLDGVPFSLTPAEEKDAIALIRERLEAEAQP